MGGPLDDDEARYLQSVALCDRFGWPLEYAEDMEDVERARLVTVLDALDRARAWQQNRGGK